MEPRSVKEFSVGRRPDDLAQPLQIDETVRREERKEGYHEQLTECGIIITGSYELQPDTTEQAGSFPSSYRAPSSYEPSLG